MVVDVSVLWLTSLFMTLMIISTFSVTFELAIAAGRAVEEEGPLALLLADLDVEVGVGVGFEGDA